jgi:hypothetical protein
MRQAKAVIDLAKSSNAGWQKGVLEIRIYPFIFHTSNVVTIVAWAGFGKSTIDIQALEESRTGGGC